MITWIYPTYQVLALIRTGQAASVAPIESLISAAAGNRTTLNTQISPAWVSSSAVRGTSDILWSCILTLTACIYTAIHLNIPPGHGGKWQFLWRKSKWVAIALFAPEIVLYCALAQFLEARKFIKELNRLWADKHASKDHAERLVLTQTLPNTAPTLHSDDQAGVVEQDYQVPSTGHGQIQDEIPPSSSQNPSTSKLEDAKPEAFTISDSGYDAGPQASHRPPPDQLSAGSKINADSQLSSRVQDPEKGIVST